MEESKGRVQLEHKRKFNIKKIQTQKTSRKYINVNSRINSGKQYKLLKTFNKI